MVFGLECRPYWGESKVWFNVLYFHTVLAFYLVAKTLLTGGPLCYNPKLRSQCPRPLFAVAVAVIIGLVKDPIIDPAVCQVVDSLDYLRPIHTHPSGLDADKGTVVGNTPGTHSRASSAWLRRCFFSVSNSWAICAGVRRVKGHVGHCAGVFIWCFFRCCYGYRRHPHKARY